MKEADMKWYTLPHRSAEANALAKKFEVRGIPPLSLYPPKAKQLPKMEGAMYQETPRVP